MEITKDALINIASNVKDKIDIEEVFDEILISAKIDQALDQLEERKYLTSEELDEEIKKWQQQLSILIQLSKTYIHLQIYRGDSKKYAVLESKNIKQFINSLTNFPFKGKHFKIRLGKEIRSIVFVTISFLVRTENQISILSIHHHARLTANNPAFKDDE